MHVLKLMYVGMYVFVSINIFLANFCRYYQTLLRFRFIVSPQLNNVFFPQKYNRNSEVISTYVLRMYSLLYCRSKQVS